VAGKVESDVVGGNTNVLEEWHKLCWGRGVRGGFVAEVVCVFDSCLGGWCDLCAEEGKVDAQSISSSCLNDDGYCCGLYFVSIDAGLATSVAVFTAVGDDLVDEH